MSDYHAFAKRLMATGVITDPWFEGTPRFEEEPLVIDMDRANKLADVGRSIAELYDEAVQLVGDDLSLLESFFNLTPIQSAMFEASKPLWHGVARADVFFTDDGVAVAELNCDTPTGEPEAVILGEMARDKHKNMIDPNEGLERAFLNMMVATRDALVGPTASKTIGIVYPTEFTEDLSLIRLYKRWLERAGYEVALGSPYNLRTTNEDARVLLFDEPIGVMIRHYKTDWWSERAAAWDTDEVLDSAPLSEPLAIAIRANAEGRTAIINPFGAVLPQNKRMMAFMWEHIHRFGPQAQDRIRDLVPVTSRLETMHPEQVIAERADWVLKSDYGAEGEEVIIGRLVDEKKWRDSIQHARPGKWVVQRFFNAEQDKQGRTTNFGVFIVAGEPSGLYVRRQAGVTDPAAVSVPVLIAE